MKQKKFTDVVPTAQDGDLSLPLISGYLDKTIHIVGVRFAVVNEEYGEFAVITLEGNVQCRSSNQVLLDQLHKMQDALDGETIIQAKLIKPQGKRYLKFVDPE